MDNFARHLVPVRIEDEMRSSYMDYSMSVIIGRALPDVRDGLKPVHRRILYAMSEMGLVHNRKYVKCAGVVGEVLKRLHPHGDSAVYDALVRMAQNWNLRYTLVDGQGNFGSVDGDPAAAYRYTECKMRRLAEELLVDIDANTVPFTPNFDGTSEEPEVLPAKFPNLLVNGSEGIAVGMATKIPPHNLGETISACIALIDDPDIEVDGLMQHIPGPDFPTGGTIYGRRGVREAYATGRGRIVIRGRAEIEIASNGRQAIVIDEIPYQVNKARLVEQIADLVKTHKLEGVSGLRDESDRHGMRVVVELKKDAVGEVVLNHLYKQTPLQMTFGAILLAIVNNQPRILTLKEMISHYLSHPGAAGTSSARRASGRTSLKGSGSPWIGSMRSSPSSATRPRSPRPARA
jgi:DNA gyrase subunit A